MSKILKGKTVVLRQGGEKSSTVQTDDTLRQLAFDNAFSANIISTVSNGKLIMVNSAACKLLGYSQKELLTKSQAAVFNIHESSFKKMLKQRSADGHSKVLVTAIKKNGKAFSCEITSAIFSDDDGVEKAITTIKDMSESIVKQKKIDSKKEKLVADNTLLAQTKSEDILASEAEWKKYIGRTSYDVMWDWDVVSDEIYVGDSVKEVFGCKVKNNKIRFKNFLHSLLPDEKKTVKKNIADALASNSNSWNDVYKLKRQDGSVASTVSRARIIRDESGKALHLIGATKDISRLENAENKLIEHISVNEADKDSFLLAAELSFDVIWDWNILTDELIIGEGFKELFGYEIKSNEGNVVEVLGNHLHQDDKEDFFKELNKIMVSKSTRWEHAYRVVKADRTIVRIIIRSNIFRQPDGKPYRMVGAIHNISDQKLLEEKLEMEVKLKEKQIKEAMEDAKETERADIGKELHDNINQLLGVSKLYIEMAKQGGESSSIFLSKSAEYTLKAIEEMRKLTKGLTTDVIKNMGLCPAVSDMAADISEVDPVKIVCTFDSFKEQAISYNLKLNVFRIVQEHMNNILKHAKATKIFITLSQKGKHMTLIISDNGIGFDTEKPQNGIGIANIKSRAVSYKGTASFFSQSGEGCILTVKFPLSEFLAK